MRLRTSTIIVLFALSAALASGGCDGTHEPDQLRIGVLPILDTLPMYVAEMEDLFEEEGLEIQFVPAASAAERDQLLQAGRVDGVVTDLVALALYNRSDLRVSAVRYAMTPTASFAQFRVMAGPESDVRANRPEDLVGVQIGISEGTVIEYVTYRLLRSEGLGAEQIETLAVPKIPERMALLRSGELPAATLPEPLASLARQEGAVVVVDDTAHPQVSCSVYAFRREILEEQSEAVRGFLKAVSQATQTINADRSRWDDLLADRSLVPQPLIGSYEIPIYPSDRVPTAAQFVNVVEWLRETNRLSTSPSYAQSVDASFLP